MTRQMQLDPLVGAFQASQTFRNIPHRLQDHEYAFLFQSQLYRDRNLKCIHNQNEFFPRTESAKHPTLALRPGQHRCSSLL